MNKYCIFVYMKIANIVSNTNITLPEHFNIVSSIDDIISDLPTLIVGYELTKKLFNDFDILEREIKTNVYWTVKKTEDRDKYQNDIAWFQYKVYNNLIKDIKYVIVDPIQQNKKTIKKIINKIYSLNNIISYEKNNMIYIYDDRLIFGIDLNLFEYMGVNTKRIKEKIKKISRVYLYNKQIIDEYKNYIQYLDNNIKYIPAIYLAINDFKTNLLHFV